MQQASMFVIILMLKSHTAHLKLFASLSSVLVGLKAVAPLVKVFVGNVIHKVIA